MSIINTYNNFTPAGTVVIYYDEIMKNVGLSVLKLIHKKYKTQFSKLLNFDFFNLPEKDLVYIYSARNKKNPLEWLAISEFDYELNYNNLLNKFNDIYIFTPPTNFAKTVDNMLDQFSIKKIIFVSENYDKRIDFDIQHTYRENKNYWKISYVTGAMVGVYNEYKPDIIFYPYLDENVLSLARANRNLIFAIPTYGFNDNPELKDSDFNIGFYPSVINNNGPVYLG